jgi:hypothetical protein
MLRCSTGLITSSAITLLILIRDGGWYRHQWVLCYRSEVNRGVKLRISQHNTADGTGTGTGHWSMVMLILVLWYWSMVLVLVLVRVLVRVLLLVLSGTGT